MKNDIQWKNDWLYMESDKLIQWIQSEHNKDTHERVGAMSLEFEVNHSGTSVNAAVDQHIRTGAGEWTPQRRHKRRCCFQCTTFCCTWMTSALGVSLLLVLYLTLGALMFMFLGSISQSKFFIILSFQIWQRAPNPRVQLHQCIFHSVSITIHSIDI